MLKVARVSTVPHSILSYLHHYEYLQKNNVDITIICSPDDGFDKLSAAEVSKVYPLEIKRKIDPIADLISVFRLARFLKKEQFDILHSNTPKAAIVSALAGFIARVPVRIHTFTGQRWLTFKGPKKWLMQLIDWFVVNLNTHCYTDSPSQTEFMRESLFLIHDKLTWIHHGSFAGIDFNRFDFNKLKYDDNRPLRLTFLGRVVNDKGICELLDAFKIVRDEIKGCELIIIGPYEKDHDPLPKEYEDRLTSQKGVKAIGHHPKPEEILINSDLFCLPSYREGFGSVVLEAAALKVPSIASKIYGLTDAIIDKKTGLLFEVKNSKELAEKIIFCLKNLEKTRAMGTAAYERVKTNFSYEIVADELKKEYQRLLSSSSK